MNAPEDTRKESIPPERLAEAGVWIARLHGDERDRALEDGFKQWLRANTQNARAFELTTEVWEDSHNLRRVVPFAHAASQERQGRHYPTMRVFAAAAVLALVVAAIVFSYQRTVVSTGVGEQRLLTLKDGTRVFLNTATQVVVRYDHSIRRVELTTGEALFDVARQVDRPFIVAAGDQQVRVLGTSFVVRRDTNNIAVTLVDGKVAVSDPHLNSPPDSSSRVQPPSPSDVVNPHPNPSPSEGEGATASRPTRSHGEGLAVRNEIILAPGERATFSGDQPVHLDEPSVDKVTAWRRGQVVLDDTPLSGAVSEMNRYNPVKLVVERPEAKGLVVNGLFQAGDSMSFARAVAQTYGLKVAERDGTIILSGTPWFPVR